MKKDKMLKKITTAFTIAFAIATLFFCGGNESKESGNANLKSFNAGENVKAEDFADRTIMYYLLGSDLEENSLAGTEIIADICKANYPDKPYICLCLV